MNVASKPSDIQQHQVSAVIERLLTSGATDHASVNRAREAAEVSGDRLDKVLVGLGLVEESVLTQTWATLLQIPLADLSQAPEAPLLDEQLSARFLQNSQILPFSQNGGDLYVAVVDPLDHHASAAIAARTGLAVQRKLITSADFAVLYNRLYGIAAADLTPIQSNEGVVADDIQRLQDFATDAPAIKLIHSMIERAIDIRASDIHLTMGRNGPRLRYRVDGLLADGSPPPPSLYDSLISRLKVLAGLDIAECRLPQDGRIRYGVRGREIDMRVATMPHLDGEGAVLRILDRKAVRLDLIDLGFPQSIENQFETILTEPHGIFLVTGPTGSGKTTSLYAALRRLVKPDRNVISVEDPVEYQLDGVAQIQVNKKIGLDFPTVLRSVLRQDPDIIMVGEIRDSETASIANQAALTGHFVLATLHTNSAAGALPRLIDMGVEPYLLSSTIRGALSQRLVRRLCRHCSRPTTGADRPTTVHLDTLRRRFPDLGDSALVREPIGCEKCGHTGYMGRFAIAELLPVTDSVREALLSQADAATLEHHALSAGMTSLLEAGAREVFRGQTSLPELLRAIGERYDS